LACRKSFKRASADKRRHHHHTSHHDSEMAFHCFQLNPPSGVPTAGLNTTGLDATMSSSSAVSIVSIGKMTKSTNCLKDYSPNGIRSSWSPALDQRHELYTRHLLLSPAEGRRCDNKLARGPRTRQRHLSQVPVFRPLLPKRPCGSVQIAVKLQCKAPSERYSSERAPQQRLGP
jgi:hypothetical protein